MTDETPITNLKIVKPKSIFLGEAARGFSLLTVFVSVVGGRG